MVVFIKKEQKSSLIFFKMLSIAIVSNYFGIGWGFLYIATINSLPSVTIKFN